MSSDEGGAAETDAQAKSRRKGYLAVFAGAVCISFSPFFVKDAPVDPSAVAFYRLFFGAIPLLLIAVLRKESLRPPRKILSLMLFAGMFFASDILLWHESIVLIGPGIATILSNFQVIFLALYGVFFLKERMSWPQRLSIPLALLGLVLLLGLHAAMPSAGIVRGGVLGLLSALFYACYVLTLRQTQSLSERMTPIANMACVSLMVAACIALYCAAAGISLAIPDLRSGLTLAALGVLCQSLGWLLLSLGLPRLSPFRAGIIMLTQPTLSFIWDALFYGSVTEPANYLGALMAICAIGMGIYAPKKGKSA